MKQFILFLFLISFLISSGQNVSINANGTAPDNSAMLDVFATDKGVLIPRMTEAQKNAITNPATSLIIFQSNNDVGFYFNAGTPGTPSWIKLMSENDLGEPVAIQDADGDTKIDVAGSGDDDIIRFEQSGTEYFRMDSGRFEVVNSNNSVSIGNNSGAGLISNNNSFQNVVVGNNSMNGVVGRDNLAIGFNVMTSSTSIAVRENTAIGQQSMQALTTGYHNTAVGRASLTSIESGFENTSIGRNTLSGNTTGSNNVALGNQAGASTTGSLNVFIGNQAGSGYVGDNALFIDNSNTNSPLIFGDFANDSVKIYGVLSVDSAKNGTGYSLPGNRGTSGEILHTDGLGKTYWSTSAASAFNLTGQTVVPNSNNYRFAVGTSSIQANFKSEIEVNTGGSTSGLLIDNQSNAGSNKKIGLQIEISSSSSKEKYGIRNYVIGTAGSSDSLFGNYTEITPNNTTTTPPAFAYKSKFMGTDGTTYGVYTENEDYNYFSGKVGIGTNTPNNLLTVYSAVEGAYFDLKGVGDAFNFSGFKLDSDEGTDKSWAFYHRKIGSELNNFSFEFFDGSTYIKPFNITPGGRIGVGNNNLLPTSDLDVVGDIEIDGSGGVGNDAFYFGDPSVDGTWRIKRDGNDLSFERRESGTWIFKMKINP